jgi:hypothetical protein
MKKISGVFLGSGAARYFGLGFLPDFVRLRNIHAADLAVIDWHKRMRAYATAAEGVRHGITTGAWTAAALTLGTGIKLYKGGDRITAEAVTHLVPACMHETYRGDMRDKGTLGQVNKWTLDTSGAATGHVNVGVSTTYVGVGSAVMIDGFWSYITALTNDGDAANEVTLDQAAPSGDIEQIRYKYDFVAAPVGMLMPEGIYVAETGACNATSELCFIEAGLED